MSTETTSRRRRSNKTNGEKKTTDGAPAPVVENTNVEQPERQRKPRIETVPVPEDLLGQTCTGTVSTVILLPTNKLPIYGYINLGDTVETVESIPRIYFNRKEYSDETHRFPRKAYQVTFVVGKDEQGRFSATSVKLTEQGRAIADQQKKDADAKKAAAKAAAPAVPETKPAPVVESAAEKKTKKPRPVYPVITVKVTVEGIEESKEIEIKAGGQLGPLKKNVLKIFNTSGKFEMQHNTEAGAVSLNNAVLKSLKAGDHVHFKKVAEEVTSEDTPTA